MFRRNIKVNFRFVDTETLNLNVNNIKGHK